MATQHSVLRSIVLSAAKEAMPQSLSVEDFYDAIASRVSFDDEDLGRVQNDRVNEPNWKRNTRNVLQSLKSQLRIVNAEHDRWRLPTPDPSRQVDVARAWDVVRVAAIAARDNGAVIRSVSQEKRYRIRTVESDRIELDRLDANKPESLSRGEVERCLGFLNAAGGSVGRRCLHYTVAKETALVYLHPQIDWTQDGDRIEIVGGSKSESGIRQFGALPNVAVGAVFQTRAELAQSGVHKPLVAGISGSQAEGADSIVMSGGYEDDEDFDEVVVYTGHGGNDPNTGRQVDHQEWNRGNQALRLNRLNGLPVRVVRGSGLDSPHAPESGFRYDGLYYVEDAWQEVGKSGFRICRFRLVRDEGVPDLPDGEERPRRAAATVQRIVRSSSVTQGVKALHRHICQACGKALITPAGPYAEAAHIRPLGAPHDGPDVPENILCLCPTCHVLFDNGGFVIEIDLVIRSVTAPEIGGRKLRTVRGHQIEEQYLGYHRALNSFPDGCE